MKEDRRLQLERSRQVADHGQMVNDPGALQSVQKSATKTTKIINPQRSRKTSPVVTAGGPCRVYKKASPPTTEPSIWGLMMDAVTFKPPEVLPGRSTPNSRDSVSYYSEDYTYEERQDDEESSYYTEPSRLSKHEPVERALDFLRVGDERTKDPNNGHLAMDCVSPRQRGASSHATRERPIEKVTDVVAHQPKKQSTPPNARPESPFEKMTAYFSPSPPPPKEQETTFGKIMDYLAFPEKLLAQKSPAPPLSTTKSAGSRTKNATASTKSPKSETRPEEQVMNTVAFPEEQCGWNSAKTANRASQSEKKSKKITNWASQSETKNESTFEKVINAIAFPEKHCACNASPASEAYVADKHEPKSQFSDEGDILDAVFEGRLFSAPTSTKKKEGTPSKKLENHVERFMDDSSFPEKHCVGNCTNSSQVHTTNDHQVQRESTYEPDVLDDVFEGRIFSNPSPQAPPKEEPSPQAPPKEEAKKEENVFEKIMDFVAFPEKQCAGTRCGPSQDDHVALDIVEDRAVRYQETPNDPPVRYQETPKNPPVPKREPSSFEKFMDFVAFPERQCACGPSQDDNVQQAVPQEQDVNDRTFGYVEGAPGDAATRRNRIDCGRSVDPDTDDIVVRTIIARRTRAQKVSTESDMLDHLCTGVERYTCGPSGADNLKNDVYEIRRNRSLISDTSSVTSTTSWGSHRRGWKSGKARDSKKKPNLIQRFLSTDK